MAIITLTEEQFQYALSVGKKRRAYHVKRGTQGAYGFNGDPLKVDLNGAIAEYSVKLYLNEEWIEFSEDFQSITSDVGRGVQVRSTDYPYGNLLVHPKDPDDQVFILVKTHNIPFIELAGWVYGRDAKKEKYWEDGTNWPAFKNRACFRYPYELLNPMETLPTTL